MLFEEWSDNYKKYPDTVKFIQKTYADNGAILKGLIEYTSAIYARLAAIATAATPPPPQPAPAAPAQARSSSAKNAPVIAPPPELVDLRFPEHIAGENLRHFRRAAEEFQKTVVAALTRFRTDYTLRMENALHNLNDSLAELEKARNLFILAHETYVMQQSEVIQAFESKDPKLAKIKAAFKLAHDTVVARHTAMNEVTVQTAMRVESALTEYEVVEEWRSATLQEFLRSIAQWLETLAISITAGVAVYDAFVKQVPSDAAIAQVMRTDGFQRTSADDAFALIPIDTRVTKFLDKSAMFIEEQKRGLPLFQATTDIAGKGFAISLAAGEIVCVEGEDGDNVKVININGSRGLVPTTALAPYL